jgi:hypothetical protein
MLLIPIILLVVLLGVVFYAGSRKKQGTMSESAYQTLVSVSSILVTVAALVVMFLRIRR